MQAQGWDIPVQFSSTRPDRHEEGATVAKEPIAAFQAMSGSAPSLPNSPFMSCCGELSQSCVCLQQNKVSAYFADAVPD